MDSAARDSYLEAQIMTATPQRLRLLLIEAAIRFSRQTLKLWQEEKDEEAVESIIRARSIVTELLSSIKPDQTKLTRKVAGVYLFLFKTLTDAQQRRDSNLVEEAIGILEVERDTWRFVCEQMPQAPRRPDAAGDGAREITAAEAEQTLGTSAPLPDPRAGGASPGGIVLEA